MLEPCARGVCVPRLIPCLFSIQQTYQPPQAGPETPSPLLTRGNPLLQRAGVQAMAGLSHGGDGETQTQTLVQAWFLPGASPSAQLGQDPTAPTAEGNQAATMAGDCRKSHPGPFEYKFSL